MRSNRFALNLVFGCVSAVSSASGLIVQGPLGELVELKLVVAHVDFSATLGKVPAGGRVLAAQDFDGNGSTDLVLEYDPDGAGPRPRGTFLWRFDGSKRIAVSQLGGIPSAYTYPVGVCDMDHDGNWEYVLADSVRRNIKVYEIMKSAPYSGGDQWVFPGGYENFSNVVGVGDLNADGDFDLLLQDPATKELRYRYRFGIGPSRLAPKALLDISPTKVVGEYNIFKGELDEQIYSGYVHESPDGIQPRMIYTYRYGSLISIGQLRKDDAYRSWPIVAVVP